MRRLCGECLEGRAVLNVQVVLLSAGIFQRGNYTQYSVARIEQGTTNPLVHDVVGKTRVYVQTQSKHCYRAVSAGSTLASSAAR